MRGFLRVLISRVCPFHFFYWPNSLEMTKESVQRSSAAPVKARSFLRLSRSFALSRMSVPGDSVVAPGGGAHAW